MRRPMLRLAGGTLALLMLLAFSPPTLADDAAAIRQAAESYARAFYEVKPELVEASVHPSLQKLGLVERNGPAHEAWLNYWELKRAATTFNADFKHFDPKTAKREIRILDQLDKTAVVRLDAEWGIDYLQLVKIDGEWKILNIVWQTYPKEPEPAE